MATSQNGWPAFTNLQTRALTVNGVTFRIADNDDLETVFQYLVEQYAATVEPLVPGHCFGFNYRPNVNNPTKLSNHSSGTALDINSVEHPNNVAATRTFTAEQIAAVHQILSSIPELDELVHWGGDWFPPLIADPMHFELHDHDLAKLARVAARIREDDMPAYKDWDDESKKKLAADIVAAILAAPVGGDKDPANVKQALNQARNKSAQ